MEHFSSAGLATRLWTSQLLGHLVLVHTNHIGLRPTIRNKLRLPLRSESTPDGRREACRLPARVSRQNYCALTFYSSCWTSLWIGVGYARCCWRHVIFDLQLVCLMNFTSRKRDKKGCNIPPGLNAACGFAKSSLTTRRTRLKYRTIIEFTCRLRSSHLKQSAPE